MRLPILLAALLAAPPALAGGYGQFGWGATVSKVKTALKKTRLREAPDAEHVSFEREALATIGAFERAEAKRKGRKAWRRWRRRKKPKARLRAQRHWVRLFGLHARVELRFVDQRLYGAVVRVLYSEEQKGRAGEILDLLVSKYGEPTDTAADGDGQRSRLSFDAGDGQLTVFTETAEKKKRGILRLGYQARVIGGAVDRYLEGIRGRLIQVEREKDALRAADAAKKREKRRAYHLRHL